MKVSRFTYKKSAEISSFWIEAAEFVCSNMPHMELAEDLIEQDRQIWTQIERLCSENGIDAHYWPENLIVLPA